MQASYLTARQVEQLLAPINPARIQDLKGMSYVSQHDVRAHMNRIFGFGRWSTQVIATDFIFEEKTERGYWKTGYRAVVRVEIHAPDGTVLATYEDAHVSGNAPQPDRAEAHALALTSAVSTAFKRACTNLGDQFGLSLYEKGRRAAWVGKTLVPGDSDPVQSSERSEAPDEPRRDEADKSDIRDEDDTYREMLQALRDVAMDVDLPAGERITRIAALKAGAPAGLMQRMTGDGISLGALADKVAAGEFAKAAS